VASQQRPAHDDEGADEEVEGDGGVAVAPEEGHQAAEAEEDHELHIQEPLVVLTDLVTARARRADVKDASPFRAVSEQQNVAASVFPKRRQCGVCACSTVLPDAVRKLNGPKWHSGRSQSDVFVA